MTIMKKIKSVLITVIIMVIIGHYIFPVIKFVAFIPFLTYFNVEYNEKIRTAFSEDSLWVDENGRFSLEIDGQKDRMVLYDEDNPTNPICILIRTKMLEMFDYNSEFKNEDYFEIESYPYDVSWQYTPDVLTLEISKLFDYTPGTNHPSFLDIDENETIEIKFIRQG